MPEASDRSRFITRGRLLRRGTYLNPQAFWWLGIFPWLEGAENDESVTVLGRPEGVHSPGGR